MAVVEPNRRSHSRGLTLIELMIALGLVLALSAIVLPISSWLLRIGVLEGARDGVEAILLQSRARARLEGRAIEVRFVDGRLEARWFDPTAWLQDDDDFSSDRSIEVFDFEEGEDSRMILEGWARRRLPPEVDLRLLDAYLLERDSYQVGMPEETVLSPIGALDPAGPPPIRIAVFLPDGGALQGESLVLSMEDAPPLQLEVDPWTARPVIEPVPIELLAGEFPEDEPDEPDEEIFEPGPTGDDPSASGSGPPETGSDESVGETGS
jgi:prepilin-type N-terminal cleavage/methylation domain-containing protein